MSRMVILGSGTALPDHDRDNTSMVWDTPNGALLIDCGGRAYQQLLRAGVEPGSLHAVFLTHAHPDHIYGVPALVFHLWLSGYKRTLPIRGNATAIAAAQRLCDALELERNGHMCPVEWITIDETGEQLVETTADYRLWTTPVRHSVFCLAVKIEDRHTGHTLVHSSDTEPFDEFIPFVRGSHTLIHEATTSDPNAGHGHTTPRQAGAVAASAGVKRLVLIHFSAHYTMPEAEAINEVRTGGFQGEVMIAHELAAYEL